MDPIHAAFVQGLGHSSIRKNEFWLKQNFICSHRILTFRIRSRLNLRRDGDLVWLN